jgi:hypothetical protein
MTDFIKIHEIHETRFRQGGVFLMAQTNECIGCTITRYYHLQPFVNHFSTLVLGMAMKNYSVELNLH